jgi:hypothetical protein
MSHQPRHMFQRNSYKKLAVTLLLAVITAGAFATLGDGRVKTGGDHRSLLTDKVTNTRTNFSLRSGYSFRGSQVINTQTPHYTNLNTTISYNNGRTTYTVPMRKKLMQDKVTFNPNAQTRR